MGRAATEDAAGGQVSHALELDGLVCRYGGTCWVEFYGVHPEERVARRWDRNGRRLSAPTPAGLVRMIDTDIAGRPVLRSAGS
jgi:hypothetical protein